MTGSEKAFAAGADIKEMQSKAYVEVFAEDLFGGWDELSRIRKPIVAAVAGYALGGGCELAMMCDFILAADNAKFGQPEITLGVMPGHGRIAAPDALHRQIQGDGDDPYRPDDGRRRGRALRSGVAGGAARRPAARGHVRRRRKIASLSLPAVMMAKEAVNRAYETTLSEGLRFEKRMFHSMFALDDQKEGMAAFVEKRPAAFKHR